MSHATLYIDDGQIRRSIALDSQPLTIGRATDNDIVLPSAVVSAHHACIEPDAHGQYCIRDLGSTNGLLYAGRRLTQAHPLHDGDVLRIGDPKLGSFVSFTFRTTRAQPLTPAATDLIRLQAHDLTYRVGRGANARVLLEATSMRVEGGMLVAIIGASGAGKSTLLKAVCGYEPASGGRVVVNGRDLAANLAVYRTVVGYLPQGDVLYGGLTVAQALRFAGRLRVLGGVGAERISEVLELVGLAGMGRRQIGTLSGGERKRVAIAAELLIEPGLLFLDEPASGLDPGRERGLMYVLRQIADGGCGVVVVTHGTEHIMLCDEIVLLARGCPMFVGPPGDALAYFGVESGEFADVYAVAGQWAATGVRWDAEAGYEVGGGRDEPDVLGKWERARPGWWGQVAVLVERTLVLKWSDVRYVGLVVAQAPLIGGLVLLVVPPDALVGVQAAGMTQRTEARELVVALVLASIWVGLLNAAREFAGSPATVRHDWYSGIRASAAVAARLAVLAVLGVVQVGVLVGIVTSRVALPPGVGVVLPLVVEVGVTLVLATWAATTLGLLVSALTIGSERTAVVVPLLLVMQIVFSGMIFPATAGVPAALSHLTISRPAVDAMGASLDLNTYCDLPNDVTADGGKPPIACSIGTLRLRPDPAFVDAFRATPDHLLRNWFALAGIGAACAVGAVLVLWVRGRGLRVPLRWRLRAAQNDDGGIGDAPRNVSEPEPDVGDQTLPVAASEPAHPTDATLSPEPEQTLTVHGEHPPEQTTVRLDQADTVTQDFLGDASLTFDLRGEAGSAAPLPEQPASTQMISRYLIEQALGSRGIFTVYRAYDPVMRRHVAIKVLQKQYCTAVFNLRFQQEVGSLAALEHPAIVPVYDYGEIDGQPYMVMQFIDAGALQARLSSGPLALKELVPVVDRMASALDAAHVRGIVHQNLKPANILFNAGNSAFLTDFGIQMSAEMITDLSPTGIFDANYLSPEQIGIIQRLRQGDAAETLRVPASSDVYALAAVVLHALTGQPAFPMDDPDETLQADLQQRVPLLRERNRRLPAAIQPVFELALAKDPARRYPTAGAFARDFREMVRGRWFISRLVSEDPALPPAASPPDELAHVPPPPLDSTRIGRYLIERPVGQGGMATVYLAYDPLTKRRVAIKVLTDQLTGIPSFSARFYKEAEMVAALEHDSIIRVYDVGEHDEQPFIVMQYLPGGTLGKHLRGRRMRVNDVLPILERLVAGLQIAHARLIIHQDIKPSNILFNRDGQAVLSDFGIAAVVEASTRRSRRRSFGGTPRYMSPEQAQVLVTPNDPPPPISPQSDIYSLGVVLFEALTGRVPYDGRSVAEIALAHLQDPIPSVRAINPLLPAYAEQIFQCALAKDPDARYASVDDFAEAVRALADGSWALRRLDE